MGPYCIREECASSSSLSLLILLEYVFSCRLKLHRWLVRKIVPREILTNRFF